MTRLARWQGCAAPDAVAHEGRYVRLEPLDWSVHGTGLSTALVGPETDALWTYLPAGPFQTARAFQEWLDAARSADGDWLTFAVLPEDGAAFGMMSFMRQRPDQGSIEVGCIAYGASLARTRAATEAVFLLARHIFDDLGYRRFEWKCNARNAPSRRAAERLGFLYEGTFRNDQVVKGRNRDTAWYAMTDGDWPDVRDRLQAWLRPENFDPRGCQRQRLSRATT
ncbi:GNAT family N-acetyltransferase [Tropicimonas sp. S265A]|uniref:GNAT family N-acetyltransferase n=1 Tax=Tropicimonas sp. S265A TaxID=3415134 RepID=UPI003C7EACC1